MHLVKYNAARTALAEAHAIDEVKDIRDKAEAMAAYARQAKDTDMIAWVTEIKVRAERRAGELLASMEKRDGGHAAKLKARSHDVTEVPRTLSDLGISKNESSRWQKLAAVSDEQFEHAVSAAKDIAGEVTTAAMLRAAKNDDPPKPAPAKTEPKKPATVKPGQIEALTAEADKLRERLAETQDNAKDLAHDLERYTAIEQGEGDKLIKRLQIENDALKHRINAITHERNEAIKDCKYWRKQAEKLGYKAAA